jgi:predicted dehydrogenase
MKKIGTIESIHAQLHSGMCVYNSKEEDSGAYSLFHDGTHLVDIILFLLEDEEFSTLEKVSDLKKTFEQKGQGLLKQVLSNPEPEYKYVNSILKNPKILSCVRSDDSCVRQLSVFYETEKCPEVIISMSGRSRFFNFELTITGTEGRICIGNGFLKFYQRGESLLYSGFTSLISDKSVKLPKKTLYFSNMVQNAVDFLDGKEKLKSTIQTGINSLAVLEEIKNLIK